MKMQKRAFLATLFFAPIAMFAGMTTAAAADDMGAPNKVVIQVSTADPAVQKLAINNVVNLTKAFPPGEVAIEVVAYGPGLSILTTAKKNKQMNRVASLAKSDITFSACANTMKAFEKKTGHKPKLINGVKIVPGGIVRIMQLQKEGYAYIRP